MSGEVDGEVTHTTLGALVGTWVRAWSDVSHLPRVAH